MIIAKSVCKLKEAYKVTKYDIIIIIIGLLIFGNYFCFIRYSNNQFRKMEEVGVIDTAIIVREFTGAKRKLYFEYVFYVHYKKFNGFLQYSPSHGSISIGDSFLVKYLKEDPDNINRLLRNKDRTLIVVNRNTN